MDIISFLNSLKERSIQEKTIGSEEAFELYKMGMEKPFLLMAFANEIKEFYKGKKISLCSIVNAKSGKCPENCKFCAQSSHYNTGVEQYPLLSAEEIANKASSAKDDGAPMFGIVTSGTKIRTENEWKEIYKAIERINKLGIKACASLGILTKEEAKNLKEAGLFRYHHNLETSRSFFSNICTTHDYQEDVNTIIYAKSVGLSTCCGGIIGLGEKIEHRIELAITLKELDVDSVPVNILN
ncbi:MAG: biotin synthase BioB, partial [Proteobacteria bacterium]|nr:biotin synthase BioB [Pseudomonadota bacterium]